MTNSTRSRALSRCTLRRPKEQTRLPAGIRSGAEKRMPEVAIRAVST